jgi:hypothetical protein
MRKNTSTLTIFLFLAFIQLSNLVSAQSTYCFFVANYSEETFTSIRIRESGTSDFGEDLLPETLVESYEYYWVRTGPTYRTNWDVEIIRLDGTPLRFSWTGTDGKDYTRPYITLNVAPLNTLMITNDEEGNIQWDITNEDDYGFGDPCNQ